MENNFVEVMETAVKEMHNMNLETIKDMGGTYVECFPLHFTRNVVIDGKKYGVCVDVKLKEI